MKKRVTQSLLNNKKKIDMSSVKGKIERNLKRTHSILSAPSTKTVKKKREREVFMVETENE